MLGLQCASNAEWIAAAAADPASLLCDHAHCEKKAATMALSLINRYPERTDLVKAMAALAAEEIQHFTAVTDKIYQRGYTLSHDLGDSYVQSLHALIRKTEPERLLDTLLVSSIVEARSCERFQLLAENSEDLDLSTFYRSLIESEAHHRTLFVSLARQYFSKAIADERLAALNLQEVSIIQGLQTKPTMHG
jgi:tRNA-(ms[2]io[6]A)-hydroxylase